MPRVIHFEISADDPDRAAAFYTALFGWQFHKWEGGNQDYWLVKTGEAPEPGIDGGMFKRMGPVGHVNTIGVESIDEALARAVELGGEVAVPKMPIPGIGWLAYCKDTEGSLFGLHQLDPSAGNEPPSNP